VFTGIIDDVGTIESVAKTAAGLELRVKSRYDGVVDGESIAVNGVCLTVREHRAGWFAVSAMGTTLSRTTVDRWQQGGRVNLERALATGDRLGGHMVAGHVDAVGRVSSVRQGDDFRLLEVAVDPEVVELSVLHGSIAVDGVSLTINDLPANGTIQVSLIDYTLRHTTLGDLKVGDGVNVEADMIGKYVAKLVQPYKATS
jgi:riboflavin synthase